MESRIRRRLFMKQYFEYFSRFFERKFSISDIRKETIIFDFLPDILCSDGTMHAGENESALLLYLYKTWTRERRNNILLVGAGGAGKTIGMYHIWQKLIYKMINVIYIPLIELEVLEFAKIEDYIREYVICNRNVYEEFMEEIETKGAGSGTPDLVLLLDGYNEMTCKKSELVINLRKWQLYERVQILVTSREASFKNMEVLKLKDLEEKIIQQYMNKCGQNVEKKMQYILKNPMMLCLYVNVQKYYEENNEKDYVELRKKVNPGTILWNFVHLELLKCDYLEEFNNNRFACEKASLLVVITYILPYVGWRMVNEHTNYISYYELDDMINILQKDFENKNLTIRKKVEELCFFNEKYQWDSVSLKKIIFEQLYLMRTVKMSEEKKVICFVHQNFRDFFSCYYYYRDLFDAKQNTEPLSLRVWERQKISYETMKFLCDLVEIEQWEKLTKVIGKSEGYAIENLFKVLGYIYNEDFRKKSFEGLDLRNVCLKQYKLSDSKRYTSFKKCLFQKETFGGEGHRGRVVEVAYSKDGNYIASICTSGTMKIWDCKNYDKVDELCMDSGLYALVWIDNIRILIGTVEGECIEYNIDKKEKRIIKNLPKEAIKTLAYINNRVIIGSAKGKLYVINQNEIYGVKLHESPVVKIRCTDKYIFSLDQEGKFVISRMDDLHMEIELKNKSFSSIDMYGDKLMVCTLEGEIFYCDLSNIEIVKKLNADWQKIFQIWRVETSYKFICICIVNETMAICGTRNGEVVLCNMGEKMFCMLSIGHRGWIRSLDALVERDEFVSGGSDGKVIFWDINSMNKKCEKSGIANMVLSHDYLKKDEVLISTGNDCKVNIWDLKKSKKRMELIGHNDWVRTISVAKKHDVFISGGSDGRINLWEIINKEKMEVERTLLFEGKHRILSLEWLNNDLYFFSSDYDGKILAWQFDFELQKYQHRELYSHDCPVYCVNCSTDDKILVSGDNNGVIILWDVLREKIIERICVGEGPIRQIRWFPIGKQFAVCLPDYGIIIYSYHENEKKFLKLKEFKLKGIRTIACRENSLFFAGSDKILYCVSLKDDEIKKIDQLHSDYIDFINMCGDYVSTSGHDGQVIVRNIQLNNYQVLQALPDVNILNCDFEDCSFENRELRNLIVSNGGRIFE